MTEDQNFKPLAMTIEQACKFLNIGRSLLYEEIKEGRLIAKKVGSKTLIPTSSAEKWFDNLPEKLIHESFGREKKPRRTNLLDPDFDEA